jgi:hypothetical protein
VSCESGSCSLDGCKQGFHNIDGDDSNGCEYQCTTQGQSDRPDVNGTDENCDGMDGIRVRSVFVATPQNGGDDSNSGRTVNDPLATVTEGIEVASNCSPECDVLISAGTYDETVTLVTGVHLYGGYDSTTWVRNPSSHTTVIQGQNKRAVIANNLGGKTVVDGLEIHGTSYSGNGRSTYGVWVENTSSGNLELDYVRVEAGDGGDGMTGGDGGGGADGSNGSVASDNSGGAGGSSSCGADGGAGGWSWDCGNSPGDRGLAGGDSTGGGYGGAAGTNQCGGCSDSGGGGGNGSSGDDGSNGSGGSGPTDKWGSFNSGTFWTGATGAAGSSGTNGRGGGGGGAGGSDKDGWVCGNETDVGGGGGGGGAGGCAGSGGQPGRPGGGSFGIVLKDSEFRIEHSTVVLGAGGDGGDGGRGGDGGSAGAGRSGDSYEPEGGTGGAGADGGDGGAGGGGPGGCGGPAIGIAEVGSSNYTGNDLTFNGGGGGSGGAGGAGGYVGGNTGQSRASSGDDGCDGGTADTRSY